MKSIIGAFGITLLVINNGCVNTSNFYSGRTLEENKYSLAIAADDLILTSKDNSITVSKSQPFTPSVAFAYGLPYRFESSIRYIPTRFIDFNLRDQINPRSFDFFDCSLNLDYATLVNNYSYLKYGATVSKSIHDFEPYVNYSEYKFINANSADVSDRFIVGIGQEIVNRNRSLGFGIGIPLRKAKIYPEINYQDIGNGFNKAIVHFGIGFRVYGNQ